MHGGSKHMLVDVEIDAISFADRTPLPRAPPTWDTVTLRDDDTVNTATIESTQEAAPGKLSVFRRLISTDPTPKVEKMKTLEPPRSRLVVRHVASAGTLRELARWSGKD